MPETFDPYHRWLGIPPEEQPADCYRLLGVKTFESDPDVIEAAGDRQMAHLRTYQTGKHGELSQKLLNEVAAAKVCLLHPEKKPAYDDKLQKELAAKKAAIPKAIPLAATPSPQPEPSEPTALPMKTLAILGGSVVGLLLIVLLIFSILPSSEETVLAVDWPETNRGAATLQIDGQPVAVDPYGPVELRCEPGEHRVVLTRPGFQPFEQTVTLAKGGRQVVEPVWHAVPPTPKPDEIAAVEPPTPPNVDDPVPAVDNPVPPDDPATATTDPGTTVTDPSVAVTDPGTDPNDPSVAVTPPEPPPVATKLPVPAADAQVIVFQQLQEVYDLDKQRTAAEKLKLARDLFALSKRTTHDMDERFGVLRKAMEVAGDAGDAMLMFQAVDTIAADFDVNPIDVKRNVFAKLADGPLDAERIASLVAGSRALIDEAVAAERYDVALEAATLAFRVCQNVAGRDFRKETLDRRREIEELCAARQKLEEMLARVEANPADGEAHLFLGRWYCFSQDDWMVGLGHLAKGSDAGLAAVARRETDEGPNEPADQVALADAWWDLAQTREGGQEKTGAMRRAGAWYRQAQPSFPGGLEKVKIERRLAEIAALGGAAPELPDTSPSVIRPAVAGELKLNEWVDLLGGVEVPRNRVLGTWQLAGDVLTVPAGDFSRIMLPIEVAGSYDLEVEFTRHEGDDAVAVILPIGPTQCAMLLSVLDGKGDARHGVAHVQGRGAADPQNPLYFGLGALPNGRKHTLMIAVRSVGRNVAIQAALNGKLILSSAGDVSVLSLPNEWSLLRPNRAGLGANKSAVEFHRVRFRLLGGKATALPPSQPGPGYVVAPQVPGPVTLPPVPATPDVPQGQWVDLLAPVDIDADQVAGKWTRDGEGVAVAPDKFCRLMLPVRVDGSYELAFEFTRHSGENVVGAKLPVGSTDCCLALSLRGGEGSGIAHIDGREGHMNASTRKPGTLQNGRRYSVLVRVQLSGEDVRAEVLLDGQPYIGWVGKQASLEAYRDWRTPDKSRPALTAYEAAVTFHTVRFRLLSGKATWVRPPGTTSSGAVAPPAPGSLVPGLVAEYFKGTNFEELLATRIEPTVDLKWARDEDSPIPKTNMSARRTGWLVVPETGTYTFDLNSNDGHRVWLDGKLVMDP
ncbi:MAG TPA: PA14 domain-containing protein [Thermoguttaceae bacterium]|nr:PA14 domain-containing protein [Thermoguttaceae bacterium]